MRTGRFLAFKKKISFCGPFVIGNVEMKPIEIEKGTWYPAVKSYSGSNKGNAEIEIVENEFE